jgi:hypothetical protein
LRPSQPYHYPDQTQSVGGFGELNVLRPWSGLQDRTGLGVDPESTEEVLKSLRQTLPKCSFVDFLRAMFLKKLPKEICTFSLGATRKGNDIVAYFFPGTTAERALVISGVHGSELSGIEVTQQLIKGLFEESKKGSRPHFNVIIVPEIFPDNALVARAARKRPGDDSNEGRLTTSADCPKRPDADGKLVCIDPNRQFPTPGRPFDPANPVDSLGTEIENENVRMLRLIGGFGPSRIASVHAHKMPDKMKRDQDAPGIFADRHTLPPNPTPAEVQEADTRTQDDCKLALKMAARFIDEYRKLRSKTTGGRDRIPGNWPDSTGQPTVCEYGSKASHQCGISLGSWGPRAIRRIRSSITVITIEVRHYYPSGAAGKRDRKETPDGVTHRSNELKAHAAAIRDVFLGP